MAFNTGNPLGSTDPRDLSDNAENFDRFSNGEAVSYSDRFGNTRKSIAGMEQEFDDFLAASGYEFLGDYAAGIEVTAYNQIIRESGEFWRAAAGTSLPYTTTGAGMPESGAFVSVGDAALRQELESNTSTNGSDLIAHTGTSDTVTEALDKRTVFVGSVAELKALPVAVGRKVSTLGYYSAGDGGGNDYEIVAGSTGSDDGGSFIDLDNGLQAKALFGPKVIVEQFGVDGTASASDFAAWLSAVDYCIGTNGIQLCASSGKTYLFDPSSNSVSGVGAGVIITPLEGESFFFNGSNSTFKFVDGMPSTAGTFWHMFYAVMSDAAGATNQAADQVIFENMVIDGNYRGQPSPAGVSDYEQRAALKVQVSSSDGNSMKLAKFRNIVQKDPMADTLFVGPGDTNTVDNQAPINNCVIETFHAGARNSARAAIQLSSGCGRINISNITRDLAPGSESNSIETEFTTIGTQNVEVNISNCFIDDLEFGGILGNEDQFQVNLVNCHLSDGGFFLMIRGNVRATNCTLPFSVSNAQRYKEAIFNNVTFIHPVFDDGGVDEVRTLNLLPEQTSTTSSLWWETNCNHVITGTVGVGANNPAIAGTVINASDQFNHEIRLSNVKFDSNFPRSVQGYRTGFLNTSNCTFAGTDLGVQIGSDATFSGSWYSSGDDFTNVTGDNFNFIAAGTTAKVRFDGGIWDTLDFAGSNVTNISAGVVQSSRVIQLGATPTGGGVIGDIVKLNSSAYASAASSDPVEWSCVSASPSSATWVPSLNKP